MVSELHFFSVVTIGTCVSMMVTSLFMTWLRFFVRNKYTQNYNNWTCRFSWFMPLATALYIPCCIFILIASIKILNSTKQGQSIETSDFSDQVKTGTVLYLFSTAFAKLSIYSHYTDSAPAVRHLINWLIIGLSIFSCVVVGMTLLPCGNSGISAVGGCNAIQRIRTFNTAWASIDLFVDFVMVFFAVTQIVASNEKALVKNAAIGVVFTGFLATAAAGYRLSIFVRGLMTNPTAPLTPIALLLTALCALLELGMTIMAGCTMALRPLFGRWLGEQPKRVEPQHPYFREPTAAPPLLGMRDPSASFAGRGGRQHSMAALKSIYTHKGSLQVADYVVTPDASPDPRRLKRQGLVVSERDLEWDGGQRNQSHSPYQNTKW